MKFVCAHLKVNILVQLSQLITEWLEGALISKSSVIIQGHRKRWTGFETAIT